MIDVVQEKAAKAGAEIVTVNVASLSGDLQAPPRQLPVIDFCVMQCQIWHFIGTAVVR